MKKLNESDFLNEFKNSDQKNLLIVPSVDSKRLLKRELKYNKIKSEIKSFGEIYIKYAKKNFLNLADESIKKYYFTLALNEEDRDRREDLYDILQEKLSLKLNLSKEEQKVYDSYREMLLCSGFFEKSDIIQRILESSYIKNYNNYDNIFFMRPRYISKQEQDIVNELLKLDNIIILDFIEERDFKSKHKHYIADDIDFLIYKIASEIHEKYAKSNNYKAAIITESKALQDEIVRKLSEYNIYTNLPIIKNFYNINLVRKTFDNDISFENVDAILDTLLNELNDDIRENFNLAQFFDRIKDNIKKYNIENPKFYVEDLFKLQKFSTKYDSNIHVLNPSEILLDYDDIYQIGLSDNDFMPSDEFDSREIIGTIYNIINHCENFILCTYDTNIITKSEFMMLEKENEYVDNFAWLKGGSQFTSFQKEYFNEINLDYDRRDNVISSKNNKIDLKLRNKLSASKIESYKKCAFKYYCDYILKIDTKDDKMYADIGTFAHEVLRIYFREHSKKEYIEEAFDAAVEIAKKDFLNLKQFQLDMVISKLKFLVKNECNYNDLTFATEQAFEHNYFKDANGNDIVFKGMIDRVDYSDHGYTLIDYKLSSSSIPSNKDLLNGEALQLPIYIANYIDNISSISYININDGRRTATVCFDDKFNKEDFMNMCAENIKKIVKNMDDGIIKRTENKNNCRYCEYSNFCKRIWE